MCCSTGICGPDIDPDLVNFAAMLSQLAAGIKVERYNLGQQPMAFVQNPAVKALLRHGRNRGTAADLLGWRGAPERPLSRQGRTAGLVPGGARKARGGTMKLPLFDPFPSHSTRFLFFTGKGGVGKTSLSCATAVKLAEAGKRVLLVSTDPASNLDEVLETTLDQSRPRPSPARRGLDALNINPVEPRRRTANA